MSLKIRAILVVTIGMVLGLGLSFSGTMLTAASAPSEEQRRLEQAALLAEVIERVKAEYVEPIDDAELLESAIRGMVADLDAHSEFLDASEYRDIRASTTGSYSGVGIEVAYVNDSVRVIAPIADSPAARAGIRTGDELVAVDGVAVNALRINEALDRLRGNVGTTVTLTVRREEDVIEHIMRRQLVRIASVHKEFLSSGIGYVRISQFNEDTANEVTNAIDEMQEAGGDLLDGLVLDLRNNPGGILDSAVEVSDLFLNEGTIVSADGRSPEARFTRSAHRGDILDGAVMVVLVNNGSASASEIVAGALQDHARATIVGTPTFGKGLVQTVMPLSRGRAIKLTTSHYYTPSGGSIQDIGITPDVRIDDTPGFPGSSLSGTLDREDDAQLVEGLQQLQPRLVMHRSTQ